MSFVIDQVRRIDAQLDRLHLSIQNDESIPPVLVSTSPADRSTDEKAQERQLARVTQLQSLIHALSAASPSQPLLSSWRLQLLLEQAALSQTVSTSGNGDEPQLDYEQELEWLLIGKATTQIYGLILNMLLEETIPLSNEIWYWDEVLGSPLYTGLYTVQTSPLRLWAWSKLVFLDARRRLESLKTAEVDQAIENESLSNRWRKFYGLVKESIRDRSITDMQKRFMSPVTMCHSEARMKQKRLRKLREMSASGLGLLMDEGLALDPDDDESTVAKPETDDIHKDEWKTTVGKSIVLMETVLHNITTLDTSVGDFEDLVFTSVEEDTEIVQPEPSSSPKPALLAGKLQQILALHMPSHIATSKKLAREYGRPSRLVRYWLPTTVLILSSSTILQIAASRKAEVIIWIRDLGTTTRDFWYNWVIEPVKKIVATIRHDKDSGIAIMSKESLEGDLASLQRMVVDFAVDNPDRPGSAPLNTTEIEAIRNKVREGDLTPVLKVYESDLRKPLIGTIRGGLIRALLIQVQKTKVDVEIAISGIDALLKSQELVFGFVGVTPSLLVCLGVFRWLSGTFIGRNGKAKGSRQGRMIRVLRNIDRTLTAYTPSTNGMLSYKEHGLLLCEVHLLRQNALQVLPSEIYREFLEEINDLVDLRTGVERQLKVVDRMRWAYSRWLS